MLNCEPRPCDSGVYQPRKPGTSDYYRRVEAHFEDLEAVWDDRYAHKYGFYRPYVMDVIFRYLNCEDLHFGFTKVKWEDCGHEYLLVFSCKRRHFCPSIEDSEIIKKILKHLDLWDVRRKPPARANGPPTEAFIIYDQSSSPGADDYIIDADRSTLRLSTGYPIESYL